MRGMTRSTAHVVIAVAFMQVPHLALAQPVFPSKPMPMLVGFPPGGLTDPAASMRAQGLSDSLGVQVLVDNRPGANDRSRQR